MIVKYMEDVLMYGALIMRGTYQGMKMDIRLCEEELGPMMLHHTGSKELNIRMRAKAKVLGLKLNEYGLWNGSERLPARTEREIFGALGMEYIKVVDR